MWYMREKRGRDRLRFWRGFFYWNGKDCGIGGEVRRKLEECGVLKSQVSFARRRL